MREVDHIMNTLLGIEPTPLERLEKAKLASADPELLEVAEFFEPNDPLPLYEQFGGVFKAKE